MLREQKNLSILCPEPLLSVVQQMPVGFKTVKAGCLGAASFLSIGCIQTGFFARNCKFETKFSYGNCELMSILSILVFLLPEGIFSSKLNTKDSC